MRTTAPMFAQIRPRPTTTRSDEPPSSPRALATYLLAALLCAALVACGDRSAQILEIGGPTMGTYYSVKVARPPAGVTADGLRKGIEGVLANVIALISTYEAQSELSRLNRNPNTDWVSISPALLGVVEEGQRIGAQSGGAFDITVGPLVNLWGFGPEVKPEGVPAPESIREARARVGFQKLALRPAPPAIRKGRGDIYIDLSALGEGYGADRVAAYLDAQGLGDYMVAVAGAIRVKGRNAAGTPWAIAIEEPTPGRRAVHRIIQIMDEGLSTSGDYRNFFEHGGKRYSHEIDPTTGMPVDHKLASVTVVSDSAMRADGLATALMVMGEEKGPALAEAEGIAAYFIVRSADGFSERTTAAFDRYLAQ